MRTRITPNTETFYAVLQLLACLHLSHYQLKISKLLKNFCYLSQKYIIALLEITWFNIALSKFVLLPEIICYPNHDINCILLLATCFHPVQDWIDLDVTLQQRRRQ